MKKSLISGIFAGFCVSLISAAHAAYPVYAGYNGGAAYPAATANGQIMYPNMGQNVAMQNGAMAAYPQNAVSMQRQMPSRVGNAAGPNRVTGMLPKVGSTQTNAGRQYYQAEDYERLADSGLYVGLSVGYNASISGGMSADYANADNAFLAPGAFKEAGFHSDTIIPLQLSIGAAINNDIRVDFSYLRYSNIAYPAVVQTSDGLGGFVEAHTDGGAITSNTTMINLYYNVDSYTGYLAGGSLRPYVGVGVGISLNTIADYVVQDNSFYSEMDPAGAGAGDLTGISDIYAYHNGGTTEQLAFMLEGGITTELESGIKMDFFVRYANLGKVKTSGSIVVSQTEWLGDGAGGEYEAPYDSVYHYTNWYESGRLGMVDVGLRLRLQF